LRDKKQKNFEIFRINKIYCKNRSLSGIREQEVICAKEKSVCENWYGFYCESLHVGNWKKRRNLSSVSVSLTKGNKKRPATTAILPNDDGINRDR
jgi:hypothetical protein